MIPEVEEARQGLRTANPQLQRTRPHKRRRAHALQKVLVANRGEIAKRFFFVLREEGIPSVAIVTEPDRLQSWYEFADEVVYIGDVHHYTSVPVVLAAVLLSEANAVYPGYGFLSESPRFVETLTALSRAEGREIIFIGPPADVMRRVGHKLDARALARRHGIPLLEGTEVLRDLAHAEAEAARLGYPVMVKLNAGGGGKGMTAVFGEAELATAWESARRIGRAHYGDDAIYLERCLQRPVHLEVQIFNGMAVGIRKCAVQRRNQKIIEEAGDFFLENRSILKLLAAAEHLAALSGYADGGGAGTVEFLLDAETEEFGFLELNARLQVEYPVTDQSLLIDLAKWQILHFDGRDREIPYDHALRLRFAAKDHAIECRIYAEDPWNNYAPSPGVIQELDLPTFNGIRCDFGFKAGDVILPHYDPMIGKLIARGTNRQECLRRLERALGELYIRGLTTNVDQLLKIVRHPEFRSGSYTNRLLDDAPELRSPEADAERPVDAAVFCAFAELARAVHRAVETTLTSGDLESILRSDALALPSAWEAEVHRRRVRVDFLQLGLETYAVFANAVYYGEMQVERRGDAAADFLILFRGRSHPVRVDRRTAFHVLRVMEEDGRIHYYRVKLQPIATGRKPDPRGAVRAPFQGSFLRFASDRGGEALRLGSRVEQGDPVLVIEAMKMETVLAAPVSGVVRYLVEDGDLSRLIRGTTSQGLVVGKPLTEGELLIIVDAETAAAAAEPEPDAFEVPGETHEILGRLRDRARPDGGLGEAVRANPVGALPRVLALIRPLSLGYLHDDEVAARLLRFVTDLEGPAITLADCEDIVATILDVYSTLKQIYSPTLGASQTWFGEMQRLVEEWGNETYVPPAYFRSVVGPLLGQHGISWSGGQRSPEMRLALFYVLRAYLATRSLRPLIKALLELLRERAFVPPRLRTSLVTFLGREQSERDDSLAALGRAILASSGDLEAGLAVAPEGADLAAAAQPLVPPGEEARFRERAMAALQTAGPDLAEPAPPPWVRTELERCLARWSPRFRIQVLPSPVATARVYRLTPLPGGAHRYAAVAWLTDGGPVLDPDSPDHVGSAPNLEEAATHGARLVAAYNGLEKGEGSFVVVLACGRPVEIDWAGRDPARVGYEALSGIAERIARSLVPGGADTILVAVDARRPGDTRAERKVFGISRAPGRSCLDLLQDADPLSPLWNGIGDEKDQRLFERRKWPAEVWARECFDPGTMREILIESIDGVAADGSGGERRAAVGARIYTGDMGGRPAVFFFKDSRVSGGATGDLEGRKYAGAGYYAYLKDVPLYVWNDGAGANIRQGMVSLNRAAQGFMLNALIAHGVGYDRVRATLAGVDDPVLRDLVRELDQRFGLGEAAPGRAGPRAFFLAAVGVGSSSGLDVYGSSQAAIQLMLDSEQSYRVLTGSGVIRAVTGEHLSNYEIGGARVMGQWTGTVDLIARDRIDLLGQIRAVHALFGGADTAGLTPIDRGPVPAPEPASEAGDAVLSERRVRASVDRGTFVSFKGEYVEAGALVGGFARLGGKPVLVMGPRTHAGLRSFASVVRAKELLQIADKTRSPRILVVGQRWYRSLEGEDEMAIRARMDFVRLLFRPGPPRVHIVTHPEGLLLVTLNSQADAVIYVRRAEDSEGQRRLAARIATLQVDTLADGFDLANRVLGLLEGRTGLPFAPPRTLANVPLDTARGFDMVADVIDAVVDDASFLEFSREGRGIGGSTLITGLATLGGTVVGVIADQPLAGGAPDAPGTEKFREFMDFLDRKAIPLLMLSNAPGFVPGTKQERLRIQQIGGESLDVNVLSRVPVVSVVLNQNFGGRQIQAFSRFLRPGIAAIALDRATLAVMGGPAAFDLFHGARYEGLVAQGRRDEADRMRNLFLDEFTRTSRADQDAMATGALDWTVPDAAELRPHVLRALAVAEAKATAAFRPPRPQPAPDPSSPPARL